MPKKRANGEGSIRKRKDGRWEGRYTAGCDPTTGKPIHKSVLAKTQAEAKEKLKQAIGDRRCEGRRCVCDRHGKRYPQAAELPAPFRTV